MKNLIVSAVVAAALGLAGCSSSSQDWSAHQADNKKHPQCFAISWETSSGGGFFTDHWKDTPEGLFCRVSTDGLVGKK